MTTKWVASTEHSIFGGSDGVGAVIEQSSTEDREYTFEPAGLVAGLAGGLALSPRPDSTRYMMLQDIIIRKAAGAYTGATGDLTIRAGATATSTALAQLPAAFLNSADAAVYVVRAWRPASGVSSRAVSLNAALTLFGAAGLAETNDGGGALFIVTHFIDAEVY